MLILPIGHEQETVRRTPWVSYALIAANVALFVLVNLGGDRAALAWRDRAVAAIDYLLEHPYLNTPPVLDPYVGDKLQAHLDRQRELAARGDAPSPDQQAQEQGELDRLAAAADTARHALPNVRWGFIPRERSAVTAVTYMFLHGGWMHIIGNMLFLFLSGPFVEDLYGRALFSALYFGSGVTAAAAFALRHADSTIPLVGASGAIAGVMGAFLIRLGAQRIRLLIVPFPLLWMFRFRVLVRAYVVLPLWLLEQFWYAYTWDQAGVAWWAHIGGFVFGALLALVVGLAKIEERFIDPSIEAEIAIVQNPALERAADARIAGDLVLAQAEITTVLLKESQNMDAWSEAYEIAIAAGDTARAGNAAQRLLDLEIRHGERELAGRLIVDARERMGAAVPLRFLMSAAGFLEKEGDGAGALALYQEVTLRAPQDAASFRAFFRRGEILRAGGDTRGARAAFQAARAHPACVDALPQTVDRALASLGSPPS
jgi:membrane associated rhomboid family serine protease